MTPQETLIAKLRRLPDSLTPLVNDFVDALLLQPQEPSTSPATSSPEPIPTGPLPNLERIGPLWVVSTSLPTPANWETLIQCDRDRRLEHLTNPYQNNDENSL